MAKTKNKAKKAVKAIKALKAKAKPYSSTKSKLSPKKSNPRYAKQKAKALKSRPKISSSKKLDKVLDAEKDILTEERSVEKKEDRIENQESIIEKQEQQVEKEEKKVEHEEKVLEKFEEHVALNEKNEQGELDRLEKLEQEIKQDVGTHPLARITLKDVVKGLVGAFVGLAVHYTFTYGVEISQRLDVARTTLLFILSFFVGLLFIYATGFRKIKDPKILMFMPVRLFVLYGASVIMSIVILIIFYPNFGSDFVTSYKMVGGVLLAAIVGACTADLIGKD